MGNTVVLKPATFTRLTALLLAEICHEAGLPPGEYAKNSNDLLMSMSQALGVCLNLINAEHSFFGFCLLVCRQDGPLQQVNCLA